MQGQEEKKSKARERVRLWRLNNPQGYRNWYLKNQTKQQKRARKKYWEQRDAKLLYAAQYRKINRAHIAAKIRAKYIPHPRPKPTIEEKLYRLIRNRKRATKWCMDNRDRYNARQRIWSKKRKFQNAANSAARRALQTMAMPAWVDRVAIAKIYLECRRITLSTGIIHHVDHIWPLKGKGFTGLHVHWNLKIIPALENRKKWNLSPQQYYGTEKC